MSSDALTREGAHVMTVCNACRYCEQYCPVFPAMERRTVFAKPDLNYLANLCHNCGECLYACQYAPPHEFGINVPRTLAKIRVRSYEEYAWPALFGGIFRHHNLTTSLGLAAVLIAVMLAVAVSANGPAFLLPGTAADFYSVVPHAMMVGLFGVVGLFDLVVLTMGVRRCWRDIGGASLGPGAVLRALRDVVTLRHLHAAGADCVTAEEQRTPWRRVFHHATFYGFLLCFASTSVAAFYHTVLGFEAPYAYDSLPVLLGTAGGFGLLLGPIGLWAMRRERDPDLGDPDNAGLEQGFLALLVATSVTGLALLVMRHGPLMGLLLVVHLGFVLALFLTLPYGKFVHGFYRTLALVKSAAESHD